MGDLSDMWWHQCNDFHGSVWIPKGAKSCPYCGYLEENGTTSEEANLKDTGAVHNEL